MRPHNNIKKDIEKNRPVLLIPILNTMISVFLISFLIVLKVTTTIVTWGMFIFLSIIIIMFCLATWFGLFFSKKQTQSMLKDYEKETEQILKFIETKKNFKSINILEGRKINVQYFPCDNLKNSFSFNEKTMYIDSLDSEYAYLSIGMGLLSIKINPNNHEACGVAGLIPKSMVLNKKLKFIDSKKGKLVFETTNCEIKKEAYFHLNGNEDTYFDPKQNLVCVGDYHTYNIDEMIEFIPNAYLLIRDNEIISLWIKLEKKKED